MDVSDIIWRLAQLASLPFQERYVIGGTVDERILDIELLENVDGLKYRVWRPENRSALDKRQIAALEDLFSYIETHAEVALSAKSREDGAALIRESDVWKTLRAKASAALASFGVSEAMSVEEIDQLSK